MVNKKLLFCFIGPGASGKSSICSALAKTDLPISLSVSTTTRTPRPYEIEGRDYFFVSREIFLDEVGKNNFIEYAEFAGNMYGTSLSLVTAVSSRDKHSVLEIEIQGVRKLKESTAVSYLDCELVVIFVCPPSKQDLIKRFQARGADSQQRIEERMRLAEQEITEAMMPDFSDYIIINKDLDSSIDQARAIVIAELCKRERLNLDSIASFLK